MKQIKKLIKISHAANKPIPSHGLRLDAIALKGQLKSFPFFVSVAREYGIFVY